MKMWGPLFKMINTVKIEETIKASAEGPSGHGDPSDRTGRLPMKMVLLRSPLGVVSSISCMPASPPSLSSLVATPPSPGICPLRVLGVDRTHL